MQTLSDLEALLAALIKNRASGIQSVQHGDTRTGFKTDSEMATAIADLERRIAALRGGRINTILLHTNKGL